MPFLPQRSVAVRGIEAIRGRYWAGNCRLHARVYDTGTIRIHDALDGVYGACDFNAALYPKKGGEWTFQAVWFESSPSVFEELPPRYTVCATRGIVTVSRGGRLLRCDSADYPAFWIEIDLL